MKPITSGTKLALALALGGMLAMGPAIAKPDKGKGQQADKHESQRPDKHDKGGPKKVFEDRHGVLVREYYATQYSAGRCPPGLAKKNNGCMPPGQAKKWNVGQRLPANVTYYPVPASLTVQFGPPPVGHRYVRVGSDILLISVGNRLIVDAIIL